MKSLLFEYDTSSEGDPTDPSIENVLLQNPYHAGFESGEGRLQTLNMVVPT